MQWRSNSIYFKDLGVKGIGDRAEINHMQVTIKAVTRGIRSFTTLPYVFTTFASARPLVNAEPGQGSFTLVRLRARQRSGRNPRVATGSLAGRRGC